jgi:hypothetical protein
MEVIDFKGLSDWQGRRHAHTADRVKVTATSHTRMAEGDNSEYVG